MIAANADGGDWGDTLSNAARMFTTSSRPVFTTSGRPMFTSGSRPDFTSDNDQRWVTG